MHIRPHLNVRACIAAGLVLTALPTAHMSWTTIPHAGAAPLAVSEMSPALLAKAGKQPTDVIFMLRSDASARAAAILDTLRQTGATRIQSLGLINAISARVSAVSLTALRREPGLQSVTQDQIVRPFPIPDASQVQDQVARAKLARTDTIPTGQKVISEPDTLSIIHADAAQKLYNGRGVRVAVIDSGIDMGHPDLKGVLATDANGKPLYADFTGTDLTDTVGHGTATSGTIAAQGRTVYSVTDTYGSNVYPLPKPGQRFNDKTFFTVSGVAPGVRLMEAKIFDDRSTYGGATESNLVRAIQWAVANHADVISESWGNTYPDFTNATDIVALADEAAVRAGVTVVVADGNSGPGQGSVSSPATAPDVIGVGASTDFRQFSETGTYAKYGAATSDNLAYFSARGPTPDGRMRPDVLAPGAWAWATFPRNANSESQTAPYLVNALGGTSQATPIVASVAAMVINAYEETHHGQRPGPSYVKQVIQSSADDLGYPAEDQSAGRVNALRAVKTVVHQGPAILLSGSMALSGTPGTRLQHPITVINTGSTQEAVSFEAARLHQTTTLNFSGKSIADQTYSYQFDVPPGVDRLAGSLNFDSQIQVPLPNNGQGPKAGLRLVLYDPQGNLANYIRTGADTQIGSGYTMGTAARPVPGRWTAVVTQIRAIDNHGVRHYTVVPFTGHIAFAAFRHENSSFTPASLTLNPGQHASVLFSSSPLGRPGTSILTIHVRERNLSPATSATTSTTATTVSATTRATIPAVLTSIIPVVRGIGQFSGAFTGGAVDSFFGQETQYFNFDVPAGIHSLQASVAWKHPGYWFYLGLISPQGKIFNFESNAVFDSTTPNAPPNLTQHGADAFVTSPSAGRWRVFMVDYQHLGRYASEPFAGVIVLNLPAARMNQSSLTASAGGNPVPFGATVYNTGVSVEGYFTYATTDHYIYQALGGTGGTLQNGLLAPASTQVITYTTGFVLPGTREIISQAQSLNSKAPVQVQLIDPVINSYGTLGTPAPVTLGGQQTTGTGEAAIVQNNSLPIGQWAILLSLPGPKRQGPVYVAASTQAYALAPQPWIKLDGQLHPDGTAGNLAVATPFGKTTVHGTVTVPADVAPGTYHAHVFIYTYWGDKLAELPLTITVTALQPQPLATPDPLLATVASQQYFPEGATAPGLLDQMDLVNPGSVGTHVQLKLLTDNGWTTITRYALGAHSRKSINVTQLVGNNQALAAVVQADEPVVSGRLIARQGESGSYSIGTFTPAQRWYFADGYTVGNFEEYLTVVNTGSRMAHVRIHLISDQGDVKNATLVVQPSARNELRVADVLPGKAVSATVSSDVPVVAERTQLFGSQGQGVTTTIGAISSGTSGYIDPGNLPAVAQAHIALFNPNSADAHIVLTLIDSHGRAVRNTTVTLKAERRSTVDLTSLYGTAHLGARISSDLPIVAEKVAYFGVFKKSHVAGSDLMAASAPATHLVFPGGTTASGATDTLSLYNPKAAPASATITVLYSGNQTAVRSVSVPGMSRVSIKIGSLGLPSGPSSLIVDGLNGAALYATQTIISPNRTDGSEVNGVSPVSR